jgi:hypothetical protein
LRQCQLGGCLGLSHLDFLRHTFPSADPTHSASPVLLGLHPVALLARFRPGFTGGLPESARHRRRYRETRTIPPGNIFIWRGLSKLVDF